MDFVYPAIVVASLISGFMAKLIIDNRRNSKPQILSPAQLSDMGLENCRHELRTIFTIRSLKKRIKKADILLEELNTEKSTWEKRIAEAQSGADHTRAKIQDVMDSYASLPSEGQQTNKFYMDAGPELRNLKVHGSQLSSGLNQLQFIDDQILFLQQVSTGNDKLRTIDNMIEKSSALRPIDLKMNEFIDSSNSTLQMSTKVMQGVENYWASKPSVQGEE